MTSTIAHTEVPQAARGATSDRYTSYAKGMTHTVTLDHDTLVVDRLTDHTVSRWKLGFAAGCAALEWAGDTSPDASHVAAALEAAFSLRPTADALQVALPMPVPQELSCTGILIPTHGPHSQAFKAMLWQQGSSWLPTVHPPMAQRHVLTNGRYHPVRAPKPRGLVYQRFIPWLGKTLSFRSVDIEADLCMFNRWMNDPEVIRIWQEDGDLVKHRRYLTDIDNDPHMHSLIASLDDEPFGYFEVYWLKESRIAPFFDVADYDRGWHVLIGEPSFRGRAVATAWLTSIAHYIFLDDPRTQRIAGEPRIDHVQQIRNLDRSGYAKVKEFDLPHKRALLVSMLRERYFTDAFWLPRNDESAKTA